MNDAFGTIEDGVHVFRVRIYYEDTDAGGVVYYANYLRYSERARSDFMTALGVGQAKLAVDEGVVFVVRECAVRYLRSAHLDDTVTVRTTVRAIGGATVDLAHEFLRGDECLTEMNVRVACVRGGRPTRLPTAIRAAFERLVS